jgi:hypothetical protein
MTRRPNARLTDADIGRLLAHLPDPPPPSPDLTDRIVANAIGETAAARRRAPRHFGRRVWWAIAILGAAGAVTAAAANAGRFELARVLAWPQEIVRAAGWAPHHPQGSLLVRAERPTPPRPEAPAFVPSPGAGPPPPAPLAVDRGERVAQASMARPQRFARADRIDRPLRAPGRARAEARFAAENDRAAAPLADARADSAPERAAFAAPLAHSQAVAEPAPTPATHDDVDRAATDDALRFHDADEYARRKAQATRDWRAPDNAGRRGSAADAGDRRWAADGGDHHWGAASGDHPWARAQAWQRRTDNRPLHPLRPHALRGRRRG